MSDLALAIGRTYPAASKRGSAVRMAVVLDAAFDHFLYGLHERDLYEPLEVTFKGGTALRKFYIGHRGRFSFDVDFDVAEGADELLAEEIDGMAFPHFEFTAHERRGHYSLGVASDLLDEGTIRVKMDFSTRGLWLPAESRSLIPTPLHAAYPFDTTTRFPVIAVDENLAEKLGRWQRQPLMRDLYDIAALSTRVDDAQVVTEMWVLKQHAAMTASSRHSGGPAASIDELTTSKTSFPFVLDDLVLRADPPEHAKRVIVKESLIKVDRLCRTVSGYMTADLYRYAEDRGALGWEVHQQITQIKQCSQPGGSVGDDYGRYPLIT